jgi:hypothetical protein
VGEMAGDKADETNVPEQVPEYHLQLADEPRLPPEKLNVEVKPMQIVFGDEIADVAAVDKVFNVTVTRFLAEVPHEAYVSA